MTLPGETEAGSAGMQPCRGITWWAHRDDVLGAREFASALFKTYRIGRPPCLENPRPQGGTLLDGGTRPLHFTLNRNMFDYKDISQQMSIAALLAWNGYRDGWPLMRRALLSSDGVNARAYAAAVIVLPAFCGKRAEAKRQDDFCRDLRSTLPNAPEAVRKDLALRLDILDRLAASDTKDK